MIELLEKLCALNGTSGDEDGVAEFILSNIPPKNAVIRRDTMGNVLVFKKGRKTPDKTVMFAAHMDEVALIITDVTGEGYLRFETVGGINTSAIFGRRVVTKKGCIGVIAGKTVHLLDSDERGKLPKLSDLVIDIGVPNRDKALELVSLGDYCYFMNETAEAIGDLGGSISIGENSLSAKAIDDRVGCAIMLDMLKTEPEYDCVFAFTVQEEVGCRGAAAATFNLEPDIAVVIEATTACDIPNVSGGDKVCSLNEGAVVGFMDKSTVYDRELYNKTLEIAKANGIKIQTKSKIMGGNDSGVIHRSNGGIKTIAVSVPCRYLHTLHCMVDRRDIAAVRTLMDKLLCNFAMI